MKVLGMTGGVGCGKSTVCQVMEDKFNAKIIYTDEVARMLMQKGEISYNCIVEHYGDEILQDNGEIDRQKLAKIIFSGEKERLLVNSFSHPYVKQYVLNQIEQYKKEAACSYIVVETALPFEACLTEFCDDIIYVTASDEIRRERLKKSRSYSDEKITSMLKSQLKEEAYRSICTKEICNDGSYEEIEIQLQKILQY